MPSLGAVDLLSAGRALVMPFRLEVELQSAASALQFTAIECLEILRLLPGRRLVVRAQIGHRPCVLKLFFGAGARRYFVREHAGLQRLAACSVPTPQLLACVDLPPDQAQTQGETQGYGLVLEWLDHAQPLAEHDQAALLQVVGELARLHNASLIQTDPHLGNYLQTPDGRVFAIDGDGVRRWLVLSRRRALANLGLLLAQVPPSADTHLLGACAEYARVRWQTSVSDALLAEVGRHLHRQRRARNRRYLAKTLRVCTEFHCERDRHRFVVCARAAWDADMAAFGADPEAMFATAQMLKSGNSATVIRAVIGSRSYVIKRYNIKGFGHGVRRALRPLPRYRRSWQNGHRLALLHLPTARPVALLECRRGVLATVAYLVMEDLGPASTDLASWVAQHGVAETLAAQVAGVFRGLSDAELVHGDTKASNFLVVDGQVHLIDLDAMRQVGPLVDRRGRRGFARDLARFMANWDADPQAHSQFLCALQAAGMPL
jgi:tRNA A-37 threonylcarbamoyl transferase component Bud32